MAKSYKPGKPAPTSGQYVITSPGGRSTGQERTVVRGEPLPPTPKPRQQYRLVDRTRTTGR